MRCVSCGVRPGEFHLKSCGEFSPESLQSNYLQSNQYQAPSINYINPPQIDVREIYDNFTRTSKDTNPKDAIASNKAQLHLVPDSLNVYASLSFTEGAAKYGAYNWRVAGVRASVYKSAAERHLSKYWNGEWADPYTGVPHLASVIACCAIILDAGLCDKLTDDRPPKADISGLMDEVEDMVAHIRETFAYKNPHHYTIADDKPFSCGEDCCGCEC